MRLSAPVEGRSVLSKYRWTIAALLFFATTVNYLDRQIFSLLVPKFEGDLKLGPLDLALINVAFLLCYGFGMVFIGAVIDKLGTKRGFAITFLLWNLASIAHGFVSSMGQFVVIRSFLGLGEAGNFPSVTKAINEWFPKTERATAIGIVNSGTNIGFVLASIGVPLLVDKAGLHWQHCFMILGGIGVIWIFFWRTMYSSPGEHGKVHETELAHIQSDPPEAHEKVSYAELFGMKQLYGVAVAKGLTDAPWYFYLTWLPKFLTDQFHLPGTFMALALPPIYLLADVGAIGGGWLSSHFLKRGMDTTQARKRAMLICACCAIPVSSVGLLTQSGPSGIYIAIGLMCLAAAAHQGWSSNIYTLITDTIPKPAVGMAVGVATMFGTVGGAAFQFFVGSSVQSGSYAAPFLLAGTLYLIGLLAMHLILPKIEMAKVGKKASIPAVVAGVIVLLSGLGVFQYMMNVPPYKDLADYKAHRAEKIKMSGATVTDGPEAKVNWMDAKWLIWRGSDGKVKAELIKFDSHGHPFVDDKGTEAGKYKGPTKAEIEDLTK